MNRMVILVKSSVFCIAILTAIIACIPEKVILSPRDQQIQDRLSIESRFRDYMKYRSSRQYNELYLLFTPEYRAKTSFEQYLENFPEDNRIFSHYTIESINFSDSSHASVYYSEHPSGLKFGVVSVRLGGPVNWEKADDMLWYRSEIIPIIGEPTPMMCGSEQIVLTDESESGIESLEHKNSETSNFPPFVCGK